METMGKVASDWLKYEDFNHFSRDKVTIKSGEGVCPTGQLLKMEMDGDPEAATGKLLKVTADTDTVYGILVNEVDATSADTEAVVIKRHAEVAVAGLTGFADATAAELATLVETIGNEVVVRESA